MRRRAARLTRGTTEHGVFTANPARGPTTAALGAAGWAVRVAHVGPDLASFYDGVATALALPAWFGRTLDALWDSLSDVAEPTVLRIEGWHRFARADPAGADRVLAVLAERASTAPPFAVVLA